MGDWTSEIPYEKIIEWRRYLHQHPELSFQEFNTSNYIYDILASFPNLEISRPTVTCIVATLVGSAGEGKTIALRAAIDALPIQEKTDLPFKSTVDGVMHACGHDAHTAILLGTAFVLSKMKNQLRGSVKFIFQDGEEQQPGGAQALIDVGVVNEVEEIYGLHLVPNLKEGAIGFSTGYSNITADGFFLNIKGKELNSSESKVDPNKVRSKIEASLGTNVIKGIRPDEIEMIMIGDYQSNQASTIISESSRLNGSIVIKDEKSRDQVEIRVKNTIEHITALYDATYELKYVRGYPSVNNSLELVVKARKATTKVLGEGFMYDLPRLKLSEDFSTYTKQIKGCLLWLGAGNEEQGYGYINHHPKFNISEASLINGVKVQVQIVLDGLGI